ncbi:hypothetical protein AAC387_Pa01g0605 [Persea americana]
MEQQGVRSHMTRCHLKLLHLWRFAVSRFLLCWLFINFFYAGCCTIFKLRLLYNFQVEIAKPTPICKYAVMHVDIKVSGPDCNFLAY